MNTFFGDVPTMLTDAEGAALAAHAGDRPLEIGAWLGASTIVLTKAAPLVHSVDWHRGDGWVGQSDTLAAFLANLDRHGVRDKVVVHLGRGGEVLPVLAAASFSLVFVDGDHDEAQVAKDAAAAVRLVRPGGTLAFHDFACPFTPGVAAAVKKVLGEPACVVDSLALYDA